MSYDLSALSVDPVCRPPRTLLIGVEKVGKSSWAADAPDPVFLPIKGEEGIDALRGRNGMASTPVCNTYDDTLGWLYSLYTGDHDRKTVVIDSASTLQDILWARTVERWNAARTDKQKAAVSIETIGGGYGKGYIEANIEWRQITDALDALWTDRGMMPILICHVKIKDEEDPITGPYRSYIIDLHKDAASLLYRWADCIMFANYKGSVKKVDTGFNKDVKLGVDTAPNERFLYTQKRRAHPGGGRGVYGELPYEIPLSWAAFQDEVTKLLCRN